MFLNLLYVSSFFKTLMLKSSVTMVKTLFEMHSTKCFASDLIVIVFTTDIGIHDEDICQSLSNRRCIQRQLIILCLHPYGDLLLATLWPPGSTCSARGLYDYLTFCFKSLFWFFYRARVPTLLKSTAFIKCSVSKKLEYPRYILNGFEILIPYLHQTYYNILFWFMAPYIYGRGSNFSFLNINTYHLFCDILVESPIC